MALKYKLICFDLDGTIIDGINNFWDYICEEFGCDLEAKDKAFDNYFKNLLTYDEWVEHDVNLWITKKVKKQDMIKVIGNLKLIPGALETIKELKKRGLKVGIISDSMEIALMTLIPDYKELFDDIFINKLEWNGDGTIAGWTANKYCMEKKAAGLRKMADNGGFDLSECVFVGDGYNDVHAVKQAGLGIVFNYSDKKVAEAADIVIEKKDLREVLNHV